VAFAAGIDFDTASIMGALPSKATAAKLVFGSYGSVSITAELMVKLEDSIRIV
jgi:hypothetical protein